MSLVGKTFASYFKDLFHINNSNSGVDATTRNIKDGLGNSTSLSVSDDVLSVQPVTDNTTGSMLVKNQGGSNILAVDTTNSLVKVGRQQASATTQYAYFGIGSEAQITISANTHYGIPFFGMVSKINTWNVDFGTGTEPDTSFTTADTLSQYGSQLAGMLWYIPVSMTIDAVYSIEGASMTSGDTTRMHLYSYRFNSGSTNALENGTLLAHNSDVTNAGNEQVYLSTWTIDSADVNAGKVICAFFRSDSVNSDYTTNITVKYHIQ